MITMVLLGIIQKFKARHGSRSLRTSKFTVEITLEGEINNGFVGGVDYNKPKKDLGKVLSSLEDQYLDDIVGRATNENIAQYIFYQLRKISLHSLKVSEGEEQHVKIFPSDINFEDYPAQLHFNKGQSLLLREKPELAITELDQAIISREEFAEAYNLRGRCIKYLEGYASALDDFLKAVELNADFGEAWRNLGNAYLYLKRFAEMVPAFDRSVELIPNSALAVNNRGHGYFAIEEYELALIDHEKAVELDQNYAEAHYDKGMALKRLGRTRYAEESFHESRRLKESGEDTFHKVKMY